MRLADKFTILVTFFATILPLNAMATASLDFPASSPFYGLDASAYSSSLDRLVRFDFKDQEVVALQQDYEDVLTDTRSFTTKRTAFIAKIVHLIKSRGNPETQLIELKVVLAALFELYPLETFEQAQASLTQAFTAGGFRLPPDFFMNIEGVDRPQDCGSFSLFNAKAAGALVVTHQTVGDCYSEAATKAMDFMNASVNGPSPLTSPMMAALATYRSRQGQIDGGYPRFVVETLSVEGGCRRSTDDEIMRYYVDKGATLYNQQPELREKYFTANSFTEAYLKQRGFCREVHSFVPHSYTSYYDVGSTSGGVFADWLGLKQHISDEFAKSNPQPLIFETYAAAFWTPYAHTAFKLSTGQLHALLITGRDYNARLKQCVYQLANSWGNNPTSYHSSFKTDPDRGTVWLPAFQLSRYITGLSVLEPK